MKLLDSNSQIMAALWVIQVERLIPVEGVKTAGSSRSSPGRKIMSPCSGVVVTHLERDMDAADCNNPTEGC